MAYPLAREQVEVVSGRRGKLEDASLSPIRVNAELCRGVGFVGRLRFADTADSEATSRAVSKLNSRVTQKEDWPGHPPCS